MNSAGLRYEVGVSIDTGDILWVNGPYPCGRYPDVNIFRKQMKAGLDENERIIGDQGYTDDKCITSDTIESPIPIKIHPEPRARHETGNKRLKQFSVLSSKFRHPIEYHPIFFHAVSHITQLAFRDEPLFEVKF